MAKASGDTRKYPPNLGNKNASDIARKISRVIEELQSDEHPTEPPIYLGKAENRMVSFANKNGVEISKEGMYITTKQISHSLRRLKVEKGIAVHPKEIISFAENYHKMDLYYDTQKRNFVYTNGREKFVVHPNYAIKFPKIENRKIKNVVDYITASKTDGKEFNKRNYIKI